MASPTGILFDDPRAKPLSAAGLQQPGAYYQYYLTQTTTAATVYKDGALTLPAVQTPGTGDTTLAADGRMIPIYLNPNTIYRVQLYSAIGALLEDTDPYVVPSVSATTVGLAIFPQSSAEIAAGVTPVNYGYTWGDPRRYGAKIDSATDDTTALQNWAKVGGLLSFPAGTSIVNQPIPLVSGTAINATRGALIQINTGGLSVLSGTGVSDVTVRGLHIKNNAATNVGYIAQIYFTGSSDCLVENCKLENPNWAGILFQSSCQRCVARGNTVTGVAFYVGSTYVQDHCGIAILNGSSKCDLDGNFISTLGDHGVLHQDTYNNPAQTPADNQIRNNAIFGGQHAYGIAIYCPGLSNTTGGVPFVGLPITTGGTLYTNGQYNGVPLTGGTGSGAVANITVSGAAVTQVIITNIGTGYSLNDVLSAAAANIGGTGSGFTMSISGGTTAPVTPANSNTRVYGNRVQDVKGDSTYNPVSGIGIYTVGVACGGVKVDENEITNCCILTSAGRSIPPGAISFSGIYSGVAPISCNSNTISGMTQYECIDLVSVYCGGSISNNGGYTPASNVTGSMIRAEEVNDLVIEGNSLIQAGSGSGILVYANTSSTNNVTVKGNRVSTQAGGTLQVAVNAAGLTHNNLVADGNNLSTPSNTPNPMSLSGIVNGVVNNNIVQGGNQSTLNLANCTNTTLEGNTWKGTGAVIVTFSGTNTGSAFGKSNRGVGAGAAVVNSGTGLVVHLYGTASPGAGTWAIGDTVEMTTITANGVAFWKNATAGVAPGGVAFKTIVNSA